MTDVSTAFPMARMFLEAARERPTMDQIGIAASREAASKRTTNPAFEDVARVEDRTITDGEDPLKVRIYAPDAARTLPLLLFFHAGGWILGDLDHSDNLCRHLTNLAQAIVVSVDYRLCPEVHYPAPLDDCERALRWVVSNGASLGGDTSRIALLGESSGGNLAAALALRSARLEIAELAFLLLLTPALDARMSTPSWQAMGDDCVPVRSQMGWMWANYLGEGGQIEAEASPSAATAVPPGHPETLIVSAGFDPLRDEAQQYAELLAGSGVKAHYRCEERLLHAFSNLGGGVPEGLAAFDRAVGKMMSAQGMKG